MDTRVLVVDDEPDAAALVGDFLRAEGLEAVEVTSAAEALRRAATERFDLAVLDIMMSYPSEGLDIARTLRSVSATRRLPILILSGADAAWGLRDQIDEMDLPCDRLLDKPVERGRLLAAVRELLEAPRIPERALVVEDDPGFADYLAEVLRGAGFEVAVAADAPSAEPLLAGVPFDVVTLDLELAHGSGAALYRRLRRDPRLSFVPVVVITGLPLDHPEVRSLGRDVTEDRHLPLPDAYLEKPVRPEALRQVLAGLAPRARGRTRPPTC